MEIAQWIIIVLLMWAIGAIFAACAVVTPGGYSAIVAPQAVHELYVTPPMDAYTQAERRRLGAVIARRNRD